MAFYVVITVSAAIYKFWEKYFNEPVICHKLISLVSVEEAIFTNVEIRKYEDKYLL